MAESGDQNISKK